MEGDARAVKPEAVDTALSDMKLEEELPSDTEADSPRMNGKSEARSPSPDMQLPRSSTPPARKASPQPSIKDDSVSQTPKSEGDGKEETVGGDITITVEPGQAPRLSRKKTQKIPSWAPPLFDDLPDATDEATTVFQRIETCLYGAKHIGSSGDHDALDCDCNSMWSGTANLACGEDSDCINRATKMECVDGDCNCGAQCQNTRFQRQLYANVSVIHTKKKGFGLRADSDLAPHDFIYEYIGEVINEPTFRRRTRQYADEGIKHFYFMSLTKNEFIDATKKGNLGRFCNHSCNPNCYVDKWVVGEKLRMGIFAERHIKAGEELVFNYNVDRYGADPQPCYCGEPNCTGFLGGKTQTERATKLPTATIEALGIDDGDGWDTAVAKRPRKKKAGEDDEEYVNNVQPKGLDEEGVRKVMATLMQCKEKWIAVKLLSRIQRCDDDRVRNRVVQMHGYQILRTTLTTWKDDNNVILQVLDILYKFPRLTRNKIVDSKIDATVQGLVTSEHEDVRFEAERLSEEWSKLELAYRIPRKRFDPSVAQIFERRNDREEVTKSPAPVYPTGPRSNLPQRTTPFHGRPPIARRPFSALPAGWFQTTDQRGVVYYYSKANQTSWTRPTVPAAEPPPTPKAPPKSVQNAKALQDIIDSITKSEASSQTTLQSATPSDSTPKQKKKSSEKWRSLPQEKQMKLYENTLFPHIKHVMQKFTKSLPKEDLKKFAKEVGKKLVASDFKNNRVDDPTRISEKQEKKVKAYVKSYFEKAVEKKKELDKKKAAKEKARLANGNGSISKKEEEMKMESIEDEVVVDLTPSPPGSPVPDMMDTPTTTDLKRKREEDDSPSMTPGPGGADGDSDSFKRLKEDDGSLEAPTPPPPPPPPSESMEMDGLIEVDVVGEGSSEDAYMLNGGIDIGEGIPETEQAKELRAQEEALMRENEEAERMEGTDGDGPGETKIGIDQPDPGPESHHMSIRKSTSASVSASASASVPASNGVYGNRNGGAAPANNHAGGRGEEDEAAFGHGMDGLEEGAEEAEEEDTTSTADPAPKTREEVMSH